MKLKDLVGKTEDQLLNLVETYKKELMNLRFQLVSGSVTNTSRIRFVRRTIARIKTILTSKLKSGEKNA